jgi:hypothetical protein
MAQYAGSTQQVHWLMSGEQVAARRAAAISGTRPADGALTAGEEAILRRHHERRILRFSTRIGLPVKVAATAISYFKRFFLDRSVLEHDPAVIALNSLYAATKVEEVIVSAEELVARVDTVLNGVDRSAADAEGQAPVTASVDGTASRVNADVLLRDELDFLSMLGFQLICFHPYRSLTVLRRALSSDVKLPALVDAPASDRAPTSGAEQPAAPGAPLDTLMRLAARIVTRRALFTDMQFTTTPAVIAMAAVVCAAQELPCKAEDGSDGASRIDPLAIEESLLAGHDARVRRAVRDAVAFVGATREGGLAADEVVVGLEARRRGMCNPANDPSSDAYRERQRREEDALQARRRNKTKVSLAETRAKQSVLFGFADPADAAKREDGTVVAEDEGAVAGPRAGRLPQEPGP